MTWIVSLGHRDADDWEEKSACWLEGNLYYRKSKKSVGVCPRTIEGITRSVETEDQPYFRNCVTFPLSTRPEKSSGLQLVEWEADTCMLQQISLLRWQCVTSDI